MKSTFLKLMVHVGWLAFLVAASCQKENVNGPTAASTQAQAEMTAHDNSQMIAIAQDAMDVTGSAMASNGISNGRYSADQRTSGHGMDMDCAPSISSTFSIDRSHKDSIIYSGSLTIDFGTGTSCKDSTEVRKGKLIDAFKLIVRLKDTLSYNLTESVTFQGYQKDSVQVDGVFTKVATSNAMSTLTIQDAKLTYADGTSVTWGGTLTNQYILEGFHELHQQSRKVTGSISGMNRQGVSFSASISNAILFQYSCSRNIPVAGTIDLTVGAVASTIDFGTGSCDKEYTITTGGTTTTYTFKRHHHA
jgi:hypothetical protein